MSPQEVNSNCGRPSDMAVVKNTFRLRSSLTVSTPAFSSSSEYSWPIPLTRNKSAMLTHLRINSWSMPVAFASSLRPLAVPPLFDPQVPCL